MKQSRDYGDLATVINRSKRAPPLRDLRHLAAKTFNRALDWLLGIDTLGRVSAAQLGHDSLAYTPTGWTVLREAFATFEITPADVFCDLGSGKGRVVALAARRPFKRVIGIELSADLNRIAAANLRRLRRRLACTNFELVTSDAATWPIPDDLTVVYLFNPFRCAVLWTVLWNLRASVARTPRPMHLIYLNPVCHGEVIAAGFAVHASLRQGTLLVYSMELQRPHRLRFDDSAPSARQSIGDLHEAFEHDVTPEEASMHTQSDFGRSASEPTGDKVQFTQRLRAAAFGEESPLLNRVGQRMYDGERPPNVGLGAAWSHDPLLRQLWIQRARRAVEAVLEEGGERHALGPEETG